MDYQVPTEKQIEEAQALLGYKFPQEYIDFIKSGYDLGESALEALEIGSPGSHVDLFRAIEDSKDYANLPSDALIICEDNGNYFYLLSDGSVSYWDHNGAIEERWLNVAVWVESMKSEAL